MKARVELGYGQIPNLYTAGFVREVTNKLCTGAE